MESETPADKCFCGEVHRKSRPRITPTSEHTRLVEVYCSPDLRPHLSQHLQGDGRPALDDGTGRKTFWTHVADHFNQPDLELEPYIDEHTTAGNRAQKLDCRLVHYRDAEYLKSQWTSLIKTFTDYIVSWTKSGQQDPNNFWDFCNGDRVAYYTVKRLWSANLLYATTKKVVPEGVAATATCDHDLSPHCLNTHCATAEEAYDAGVTQPGEAAAGDASGNAGGAVGYTPASGPQGTKRLKVAKGRGSAKKTHKDGGGSSSQATKLGLMLAKFAHDKKRKDAAFAAEILQNAAMPKEVTDAAKSMLLEFFGCSTCIPPPSETPEHNTLHGDTNHQTPQPHPLQPHESDHEID